MLLTKLFFIFIVMAAVASASQFYKIYIGTWSATGYELHYDATSNQLKMINSIDFGDHPSYIIFDQDKSHIIAVNELHQFLGKQNTGGISVYNRASQAIVSQIRSLGMSPCYIELDKHTGSHLTVANYNDVDSVPSASVFAIFSYSNGHLNATPSDMGSNVEVAPISHPHQFVIDPSQRFAFMVDLGANRINQFLFNPLAEKSKTLQVNPNSAYFIDANVNEKVGPRHLAFHPSLPIVYLAHEHNNTMSVLNFDQEKGTLSLAQVISMLPNGANTSANAAAEVQVSPDGKFVYGSNRGAVDGFVIYKVDQITGRLELVGFSSSGGKFPRHFVLNSKGDLVFVANQNSDNLTVFARNVETGSLKYLTSIDGLKIPTCVLLEEL